MSTYLFRAPLKEGEKEEDRSVVVVEGVEHTDLYALMGGIYEGWEIWTLISIGGEKEEIFLSPDSVTEGIKK